MIAEHAAAVKAALDAEADLTVFDGKVPDLTKPPYVVMWVSLDNEESVSFADEQGKPNLRVTTHSVGAGGQHARIVADHVRNALLNKRLVIAGRTCWKIRHEYGVPPQTDESTGTLVVDVVDVWTFSSVPA